MWDSGAQRMTRAKVFCWARAVVSAEADIATVVLEFRRTSRCPSKSVGGWSKLSGARKEYGLSVLLGPEFLDLPCQWPFQYFSRSQYSRRIRMHLCFHSTPSALNSRLDFWIWIIVYSKLVTKPSQLCGGGQATVEY